MKAPFVGGKINKSSICSLNGLHSLSRQYRIFTLQINAENIVYAL